MLSKSIMFLGAVVVPNIGSAIAIIPRPPNVDSCVSKIYLLASASSKAIAVNCSYRLSVWCIWLRSQSIMVLSKSFSAYALDKRLLYNGAVDIARIDVALSGFGKFDLKNGFMTYFRFLLRQA